LIPCVEARPEHIPGIFVVRVAVVENALDLERLRGLGITPESTEADLAGGDRKGWVVEEDGQVVGFSIADAPARSIWALFVMPGYEGRGYGRRLLDQAVAWLWSIGADRIWLETASNTRAAEFYRRSGWLETARTPSADIHFELERSSP
jgi:GNAT superfamily N-acetyltransferase